MRSMQREIGIAQHLPRHDDEISQTRLEDRLRLNRVGDESHRPRHYTGSLPDPLGKRHLVTGTYRYLLKWYEAAGRTIDDIDLQTLQQRRELYSFFDIPSTLRPIRGGDTHE